MPVFELHFNPKTKKDLILDSFVYEPEHISEKRLGSLYVVGELAQAMPQKSRFLSQIASVIKKEYYAASLKKSPEASLKDALKKANEFLDVETRKGDVSWLGNLSSAVLSLKEYSLNFTKVGEMKILLIRQGEIIDISQNLEFKDVEPYPLKVFGNIASGKLLPDDKVVVLTKEVFSVFNKDQGLLTQLAQVVDEKGVKEIIKTKKQTLAEVTGICFLLLVTEKPQARQTISLHREPPKFSFKKAFLNPLSRFWKKPKIELPTIKLSFKLAIPSIIPRKKIILIPVLILILFFSFLVFQSEREKELKEYQQKLEEAKSKMMMAENLLILKKEEEAQILFQEAQDLILPLTKRKSPLREEALSLKESLEKYLEEE
ncbi:MAG: hypothetical protein COT59_01815 [Candidatus Nealsonbacteria bacterium CG09_land_8_20_14_0_10_42_14]|uniref:PPM-type phosphatase domain-containing protein n=1 Tax=Candidatus Nealsonbacteria bacterium CG09_land_8_20_14_0_10_42_14 TaxID=1974707 RepID=A0A2H0WX45_9BACT|nr:MAG: hypothetical protein COT59_01815 [Candidatus Nealsonbacteria bacterium CG09_land_8_20_14_0_10_42_14]